MSKEKRRVPKLRFPGFTEDWEQRKLNEFLSVSNLKNAENKYNKKDVLSVSGDYGIVNQIDFQGRSFAGASVSNYGVVEKGDIVYTKSPLKLNPYGIIKTNRLNNGIVSTLYAIYKTKENCDSKFIEHYFNLDSRLNQYLKPLVNKGAKNDMKVSSENALIGEVCFPKITEQVLIADLLDCLDIYITLHQRKLNNLKLKKKALLQKLFPKNGERYPELRFPGFTDAWEQRKLDELTIFIGDGLHGTPKYDENGSYYFINGNNLVDNKVSVTEETKKVAFEALGNDDRRLDSTAILMSINGTIGTLARYNNENIMLGKSVAYITPKNINRDFLFYQLQGNVIQSYFYKNLTGTTIKNLGLGTIKNTIVMSTLSEEESTIGRFFYKLDQYITLHQRKLDHLQLQKKALLQQMFV